MCNTPNPIKTKIFPFIATQLPTCPSALSAASCPALRNALRADPREEDHHCIAGITESCGNFDTGMFLRGCMHDAMCRSFLLRRAPPLSCSCFEHASLCGTLLSFPNVSEGPRSARVNLLMHCIKRIFNFKIRCVLYMHRMVISREACRASFVTTISISVHTGQVCDSSNIGARGEPME
jgi:hypothetical protein